ncbi:hypothetical protein A7979_10710 [Rothia nasimurium]|uniref:Methyltransferase type 11 domain-containing protein n=1 Tax=Rothia nasimurium TaxID=85336 RepID=A0A1Y1RSK7_9MICC|nr:methyltransferase domain-containing protein [Rothia nasimurium]ORC22619.1 hypothetical protein A7979_10710 [Rothia nasimurium]
MASRPYTHGHTPAVLQAHQQRTAQNSAAYLLPFLTAGMHVLDIGAGPGTITADFARITSRVTATEIGEEELSLSQRHFEHQGLTPENGIEAFFSVENICSLSFPDSSFDIVHAHQVIQHIGNPVLALREMARVVKPGGYVAVRDADYEGFFWFADSEHLTHWRELYLEAARANGGEPSAGRRLPAYAAEAGLRGAQFSNSTWTYTGSEARWLADSWAMRLEESALGQQIIETGLCTHSDLNTIASGWRRWALSPASVFVMPHGEILWQKPIPSP